ncbi:AAA family ATPase [Antrihabitans cavernicola]|uniref:Nuclease SbcCD subunit C n=1 Tax=Antrihabitans cavernicola TaxID=2495913 RepID=A0A5A7SGZ2_9NOCA|nr:SMC family ATPase [Spelaeibacter cavernicola]KAA0023933.1 SMC family ATPase [Spelaeibacter cavernicola]
MRLHRLKVTAFGPFAETAEVDFDALGADGLFLLHGRTGAGKTTVLDAIAFALYGTVPGARRDAKRLRSDHAPAGTVPKVLLEATIGGRRLRLVRSPEFHRPKLRGTGMRSEPAKATLTWLDGRGQNLTRLVDIGDEVNRLLGMSADQFFQVVLLPQGEFARFLRADNEDREKLLERLFDTQRFGDVETWLAERRKESAAELGGQTLAIDRLVAQVCTAAGSDGPEVGAMEWAQDLLATARAAKESTDADLAARTAASDQAAARLADDRRIADLRKRKKAAELRLDEYRAGHAYRDAMVRELAAARRAVPVTAAAAELDASEHVAAQTDSVRRKASASVVVHGGAALAAAVSWPPAVADVAIIDDATRSWTTEIGTLDEVIEDVRTAAALRRERDDRAVERERLSARIESLRTTRDAIPARLRETEVQLRAAVENAARAPGLDAVRAAAADAATAAIELGKRRRARTRAQRTLEDARSAHTDARERVLDLRERRLAGMAAELATALTDGDPCQVCGSISHPKIARPADDSVTKADEVTAAADEHRAAAALDRAMAAVSTVEREIDALIGRGGDRDRAVLTAELTDATARFEAATAAAQRAAQLSTHIDRLRVEESTVAANLRDVDNTCAAVLERISAIEERIAQLEKRIAGAAGDDESVTARRARLDALARAATTFRDARAAAQAAADAVAALQAKLDIVTAEGAFADVAAAVAAARTPVRLRAVESELAAADEVRVHAEAVLAEPDIMAVRDHPPTDLPQREADALAAGAALNVAVAAHAEAARRASQLEDLVAQLWAATDRLSPLQARHDELAGVADLVAGRGQNAKRMSLRSYVLAARLEEVAAAGTARLRRMSGGRYEFVHSDAQGPRGKRGGLGLEIRDDYTGAIRPAKTLSGGETFVASLALALGLADVVAAESGGVVLDTMFIDEGFGSLDNDALDAVMGILDELRAGGRVVGIVSHVDEMRQRIPSRLHVIRGRAGSRLEAQLAV